MNRHLVVFAKQPTLGAVKRRLAADVGAVAATAFHRRTLEALVRRLAGDPRWAARLATTPDAAVPAMMRRFPGLPVVPQGGGDLGARMERPLLPPPRGLPPGPAVIVGSDVPAIRRAHVARAFALLGRHDFVFGPAADGGYWLIGARRRPPVPPGLLAGVRWSTRHALDDSLAALPGGVSVGLLETLEDVDDGAALARIGRPADKPFG
jgi:hypothetical protein